MFWLFYASLLSSIKPSIFLCIDSFSPMEWRVRRDRSPVWSGGSSIGAFSSSSPRCSCLLRSNNIFSSFTRDYSASDEIVFFCITFLWVSSSRSSWFSMLWRCSVRSVRTSSIIPLIGAALTPVTGRFPYWSLLNRWSSASPCSFESLGRNIAPTDRSPGENNVVWRFKRYL